MKKRILFIDDDSDLCEIIESTYEQEKILEVHTCKSAFEALDLMATLRFELIVVDLNMPKITGIQLISYIRANKLNQNARLCVFSGNISDEIKRELDRFRIEEFYVKPKGMSKVLENISKSRENWRDGILISPQICQIFQDSNSNTLQSIHPQVQLMTIFAKKSSDSLSDLSAVTPIFGDLVYGSISLSLSQSFANQEVAKFSENLSEFQSQALKNDFCLELVNQISGAFKRDLEPHEIFINIGLPEAYIGQNRKLPHRVSGQVICQPILLGDHHLFAELCLGGFKLTRRSEPKFKIFMT